MSALIAALHYIALGLGFAGLSIRIMGLREGQNFLRQAFFGDSLWGIAAVLWIVTGLLRAFGGLEKGSAYYLQNHWFYAKMGVFLLIFLLEVRPMITMIRWRIVKKSKLSSDDIPLIRSLVRISFLELILLTSLPFLASLMARGT